MKLYLKTDIAAQQRKDPFEAHKYNDPGRFDICRCCPLKMAVLALRSKNK